MALSRRHFRGIRRRMCCRSHWTSQWAFLVAIFSLIGGALQATTQSSNFILVARVVTGLGTGALTEITPVLVSEMSTVDRRGDFLGCLYRKL